MRKAILALPLLLAGCTTPYLADTLGDPADLVQYDKDKDFCRVAASKWKPHIVTGDVAQATIDGGADAASYFPINPAIPALGAAGGAGKALSNGMDVTGSRRRNVEKHCVYDLTQRDHSALIANPDP